MRRLASFVAVGVTLALAGLLGVARPSLAAGTSPAAATPTLNVSPAQVADGDTVLVTGNDWPASTQVAVQVCGAGGHGGSAHCDLPSSTIVGTGATGSFGTQLVVHTPPVPCPCVVKVDAVGTAATRSVALQLAGASVAAVPVVAKAKVSAPLRVEAARLEGGSWVGWFGAPVTRTLVLRVHNVSGAPVNQPLLLVSAGRSSSPDGTQAVPPVGPFAIDETRTIRVPVKLGALAIGDYGVRVRTGAQGSMASATATTQSWPWGLFAIGLLLVQMMLLAARNATRRRLARREAAAAAAVAPASMGPTTAADPISGVVGPVLSSPVRRPARPAAPTSRATASNPPLDVERGLTPVSWMPPVAWRPPNGALESVRADA